jgi:hypothetical protein
MMWFHHFFKVFFLLFYELKKKQWYFSKKEKNPYRREKLKEGKEKECTKKIHRRTETQSIWQKGLLSPDGEMAH